MIFLQIQLWFLFWANWIWTQKSRSNVTLHSILPLVTFWLTETILNGEVKQCNKKAAESNPFGNFLRRAEKLGQKKAHPSRVCCKQSFITKGFFKRHDKNRGFPSLSLKRANIQLAGIYLADNHIRSPFAFAYIFYWQIIIGIISLLFCFVNRFSALFLKTPPSRRLPLGGLIYNSKLEIYSHSMRRFVSKW